MGLSKAMGLLGADRRAQSATRDVLAVATHAEGSWLTAHDISRLTLHDAEIVGLVLGALVTGRVLDFDPSTNSYRYNKDAVLDLEVRRFIRNAEGHDHFVRSNVDRFRQRFGRS